MDIMQNHKRTHYCGTLRREQIGTIVTVMGWVQKIRDLGSLAFIDLRDRSGIVQVVVSQETAPDLYEKANSVRSEYVICVVGRVRERSSKNPELPTGDIEIDAQEFFILDKAKTPPIYIKDDDSVKEEMRLKYRYLDLRKPRMQKMLEDRAEITRLFREFLHSEHFIEVETPFLGKPTPEGARDYLVPSRVNPGKFYALPQSPQLYKQLLMVGGTDRYYQIARCFRDEDLRANRQPDFTQVDIEMSFVDMEDVLAINERLMAYIFREFKGITLETPFRRMSYDDAMSNYGTDKPDLRYGFHIHEIKEIAQKTDFPVFQSAIQAGNSIFAINFDGLASAYARKKLDALVSYAKGIGASGLLWVKNEGGKISSSFNKFLTADVEHYLQNALHFQDGDLVLMMVGDRDHTLPLMGSLRVTVANENLKLDPNQYAITWIVDFPMFEYSEEEGRYVAKHHPFTAPKDEDISLLQTHPEKVRAKAYDIVINGDERGGGSIRIHNADLQNQIFEILKLSEDEIRNRFGFFVEALQYGTPPHGGIAYGMDRFVMMLLGIDNIRDVIAFPKTQTATDLMSDAPTTVDQKQLNELQIRLIEEEQEKK
ncbi:MAG: aspartate--tRNA ligase [Peptoniphilaceae bacterium]|nr:aspartate--tRNA ligase [Peptoniphilaceae bacterium]